jgi:hypothetical protein
MPQLALPATITIARSSSWPRVSQFQKFLDNCSEFIPFLHRLIITALTIGFVHFAPIAH